MTRKTVTLALSVLVVASFALFGCGSTEESTEDGIEQVKAESAGAQPTDLDDTRNAPQGTQEGNQLKMPPGKTGGM